LLSIGLALGIATVIAGFATLATIWLPPGVTTRTKVLRSAVCVVAVAIILAAAAHLRLSFDVSADRRNSFSLADERALAKLTGPPFTTACFTPEAPRHIAPNRNVLAKLERAMPDVSIRLRASRQSATGDSYGEVAYAYGGRTDTSRSTSPREILPLLYDLA